MTVNIVEIVAILVVFGSLAAASWDEPNNWKRWFLALAVSAAVVILRVSEHNDGYARGVEDGTCIAYQTLDARENVTIKNLPDYCK